MSECTFFYLSVVAVQARGLGIDDLFTIVIRLVGDSAGGRRRYSDESEKVRGEQGGSSWIVGRDWLIEKSEAWIL